MSTPSPSTATTIHQVSRLTITLDEGYEAFRRRYAGLRFNAATLIAEGP